MNHFANFIRLRIYNILEWTTETLGNYLKFSPFVEVDIELWTYLEKFYYDFNLINNQRFCLSEEYTFVNYRLEITRYFYAYYDEKGNARMSFDKAPHYPQLPTFPHHKHLYPKLRRSIGLLVSQVSFEML
ncbi:MAG: DUF6516 family protein [bacterium]